MNKSLLLNALGNCQAVVEKRNTIAITSHVLLTASAKGLSIAATDLDLTLIETIAVHIMVNGSAFVQAQLIHEVVKKLSVRFPVELEYFPETGHRVINSNRSMFEVSALPSKVFCWVRTVSCPIDSICRPML